MNHKTDNDIDTMPFSVTILTVFVLFMTAWYCIRIYGAVLKWSTLAEFGANPVYILGSGIFWALASLGIAVCFFRRARFSRAAGSLTAIGYFLWYWFDRLVMQPSPAPNLIFSMTLSILLVSLFLILLNLPVSTSFFSKEIQ